MDIKKRLREAKWAWMAPAAFLFGICLLPSGHIEASPGEILRPPVWMAPMAWPLLAMAALFAAAAFSARLRARAWRVVFFGACASLLLELAFSAFPGNAAIYSLGLGTDLNDRIFVDFELDVLAFGILPMDLLLAALSFLVLWTRHGGPAVAEPGPLFQLPLPVSAPGAPAQAPAVPAPAAEAPPAGPPAAVPAAPASPLDSIAPGPPARTPPGAGTVQAAPAPEITPAAPPSPAPEASPPEPRPAPPPEEPAVEPAAMPEASPPAAPALQTAPTAPRP